MLAGAVQIAKHAGNRRRPTAILAAGTVQALASKGYDHSRPSPGMQPVTLPDHAREPCVSLAAPPAIV
jgi:hypothetical protein